MKVERKLFRDRKRTSLVGVRGLGKTREDNEEVNIVKVIICTYENVIMKPFVFYN
jgi:hypothetical protein